MALPLIVWQKKSSTSCGRKIKILSPAKLNLYLNILGRYGRRFHRIESVVERISLCDDIVITAMPGPAITIACNRPELAGEDNLCVRAARLAQQSLGLTCGFHIELHKRIPVGAGLGGGSSNAASTLLAVNALLGLRLKKDSLYALGARLGSDVNFFLSESSYAVMTGRGEKISPFDGAGMKQLVVWPGMFLSTPEVYRHTHLKLTNFLRNANIIRNAVKRGDTALLGRCNFNALESSALSLCKELTKVKVHFKKLGFDFRLTGSGSALYAFLPGRCSWQAIKRHLPARWSLFAVSTF